MSAITGNIRRPEGLDKVIPSLDPSEIAHMAEEGPTPSLLHIAVLMQKWVPLRLLIDHGAPAKMSRENNCKEYQVFYRRFAYVQTLDGIETGRWDGTAFLYPRGFPYVPTVFQDGRFQPLHPTPYSTDTKPIAIFFIGNDWAGDYSAAFSKQFAKVYHRHYAEIAKHFTAVRVLIGNPSEIVPTIKEVKALLPRVPVVALAFAGHPQHTGHGNTKSSFIILDSVLRMTVSDVKKAFKNKVHERLQKNGGDEAEVRTQLLFEIATGKKRFPSVPMGLTVNCQELIQGISAEIAFGGSILFDSCELAAGDDNFARTFSKWAPNQTVYGCPIGHSNFVQKVVYTSGTPQLIPFFLDTTNETPRRHLMLMRAYRGKRLRADVCAEFPKPISNSGVLHAPDIDRSLYMGIDMTQREFQDPQWQRLILAIKYPDQPAFAGSICVLAHD